MEKHEDPGGLGCQELGRRWKELVHGFTGGDPEIMKGLSKMWADKPNWPAQVQRNAQPFHITPEMFAFIQKAWDATK